MTRLHPNHSRAALAFGLLLAMGVGGCRNPQMASTNPFLAPDRVPPPATRVIAPGTAQPYYPGEPLPTTQSAPAAAAVTAAPIAKMQAEVAPANASVGDTGNRLAFANERTVAIPSDDKSLRFSLPPPPATEPAVPPQIAAAPASPVMPAVFNQPAPNPIVPDASPQTASTGPWRDPQVPQLGSAVVPAQYVQPQSAQPVVPIAAQPQSAPAPSTMPVELRAVPSPGVAPMEPAFVPPPRMRFPNMSSWFTPGPAPAANQQLIGYMVPGANGSSQFVPLDQMQSASAGTQQPSASVASSDGFRPRGSTR